MHLILVNNDGTVEDSWDDVEEWDLDKVLARSVLISEIKASIDAAKKRENEEHGK